MINCLGNTEGVEGVFLPDFLILWVDNSEPLMIIWQKTWDFFYFMRK